MSRTSTLRKQTRRTTRSANNKVTPVAAEARDTAVRYAETTREWAAPKVEAAKDWAAPRVEPAVDKLKSDVVPAVAGAVTAALAATEPARHEAATRGSAALAALKGEVEPPQPKKHRVRKLFLLATVLGAAYAGWKAWAAKSTANPADAWATPSTTTYGTSGVTPMPATERPATDDAAGAGPDEALADAADEAAAEDESAEGASAGTTTEAVTPKNARKVSQAASKGTKPSSS